MADARNFDQMNLVPQNHENRDQLIQAWLLLTRRLLDERRQDVLQRLIQTLLPPDLAELIMALKEEQAIALFKLLDSETAGEVLDEIEDADLAAVLLDSVNKESIRELLDNMSDDALANLLRELDAAKAEVFLDALLAEDAQAVRAIIQQSSGTAGAIMTTAFIALAEKLTVAEALQQVREQAEESETINYLFVVDIEGKLVGVLSLRELLFAARTEHLDELMSLNPVSVWLNTPEEEAAELIRRYGFQALPVVDDRMIIQGIITFDDALDVLEEQGGADLYQVAGIPTSETDDADIMLTLAPPRAALKRLPWLIICIFGDMITGGVIKGFEDVLAQVVALTFFVPVLMGSAGNTGTQSLAIAVRGLASGNLHWKAFAGQLWKEGQSGILLGLICGTVTAAAAALWQGSVMLGLAIGLAMMLGLTVSTIIGMIVPVVVHWLKGDPALASGPVITTLADIFSIFVYFVLATSLLGLAV